MAAINEATIGQVVLIRDIKTTRRVNYDLQVRSYLDYVPTLPSMDGVSTITSSDTKQRKGLLSALGGTSGKIYDVSEVFSHLNILDLAFIDEAYVSKVPPLLFYTYVVDLWKEFTEKNTSK